MAARSPVTFGRTSGCRITTPRRLSSRPSSSTLQRVPTPLSRRSSSWSGYGASNSARFRTATPASWWTRASFSSASTAEKGLRRFGSVADGFDVVTVGVEHERAVVIFVVVRARAGGPVVLAAGGHRGPVERVHLGVVLGAKGDVQGGAVGGARWH